jgi:hypothetical protein
MSSKTIRIVVLRRLWGGFLLFTSVYCLLAFLPFTYSALIKAPPYDWIPWFVRHYAGLYWVALGASALAYGPMFKSRTKIILFGLMAAVGLYLLAWPFLDSVQPNWPTFAWSLLTLGLMIALCAVETGQYLFTQFSGRPSRFSLDYSTVVFVAVLMALLWTAGAQWRHYGESHSAIVSLTSAEITGWSIISHVLVAVLLLSALNLILVAAARTPWPKIAKLALTTLLIFGILCVMLLRFLETALSFDGWAAQLYTTSLAAALTLFGFTLAIPILRAHESRTANAPSRWPKLAPLAIGVVFATLIVVLPSAIQGGDWNGVIQHAIALVAWIVLGACAYTIRPPKAKYSVAAILGVALLAGFGYKGLQATAIFWAKPLGRTDDEFARTFEDYAVRDASFDLTNHALGNGREASCRDLCRILREYTNVPNFPVQREVNLVDSLVPANGERPNIFVFVIDSMRPDYLGAYNPKVDFTPNLDAFARESVVMRHAYTQYAGTSLSEPAIWAGTMLLHDHDLNAFSKINSLEKLGKVDGYREVVSYDPVVSQFVSASDRLVKLDTDKIWNQFEVCSTIEQTETLLDHNATGQPILLYTQPMNVHQFAHNSLPRMTSENWQPRPGLVNRIAYEVHGVDRCLGGFFAYLKQHNLYDNSIIVVTADHGDATGDFGRYSHSTTVYPEIMRVPIIIHLPKNLQGKLVYDDQALATLTDITPSIYYLTGHRPIVANAMFGHPLFTETEAELHSYHRDDIFFASDVHAVYGLLTDNGRYFYATYDSPAQSYLYDLANDPNGTLDILTPALKTQYDQRIIEHLQAIAGFYGYRPKLGTLLATRN